MQVWTIWNGRSIVFYCMFITGYCVWLVGTNTLEISDSDQQHLDAESEATTANKDLQQAETTLSNVKAQLKVKRDELKGLFFRYGQLSLIFTQHVLDPCSVGKEVERRRCGRSRSIDQRSHLGTQRQKRVSDALAPSMHFLWDCSNLCSFVAG